MQYAYRMNPFMQPYDEEGNLWERPGSYEAMGSSSSYQFSDQRNPLLYMQNETRNRQTWRALGNVYLQIKPVKGLTLKTTFSPNYTYYREGYFKGTLIGDAQNTATKETERAFDWTWDNMITYDD